ncbi:peptidoglycan recognition protein family protein [Salibacterium salarium]|uniref:peptidoglycan recognition protein family protein n=1 Tax=Salibacterium salarium TaxID=284579 RepID=UPI00163A6C2A|nr:N-acetylmuramoyl-L-alanine amidase [Salibacterium salarium]
MPDIEDIRNATPKRSHRREESSIRMIVRHHSASQTGDFWSFWNNTWSKFTPSWKTGGYHEIILRDGTVQVCYRPTMVTNGVANHNSYTYHICLVGNGSFTDVQEESWTERAKRAMEKFNIPIEHVLGHNELPGTMTACPGINMNDVRTALNNNRPLSGSTSSLLQRGDQGNSVKQLQEQLIQVGENLSVYGADGDYGSETESAVISFQRKHKLKTDGIAGPRTLAKLEEVISNGGDQMSDNKPHSSHEKAWNWAEEEGLMNGERPKDALTREQLATVLYRYHQAVKGEE